MVCMKFDRILKWCWVGVYDFHKYECNMDLKPLHSYNTIWCTGLKKGYGNIDCFEYIIKLIHYTVMSLLEAPCAKTPWRVLLFRAILGIMGVPIVCFDICQFKQANNRETGFGGHRCDFEQHLPCLTGHVCVNSAKFVLEAPGASILWGRYYSVTMCRLTWGHFY